MTTDVLVLDPFSRLRPLNAEAVGRIRRLADGFDARPWVLYGTQRAKEVVPEVQGIRVVVVPGERSLSGFLRVAGRLRSQGIEHGLFLTPPTLLQRAFAMATGVRKLWLADEPGAPRPVPFLSPDGAPAAGRFVFRELPVQLGRTLADEAGRRGGQALSAWLLAREWSRDPAGWLSAHREARNRSLAEEERGPQGP
jgi:hypothetical protein